MNRYNPLFIVLLLFVAENINAQQLFQKKYESTNASRAYSVDLTKDGGFYWVDVTIYPRFDSEGEKIGYTAIRLNITDKKMIEKIRKRFER